MQYHSNDQIYHANINFHDLGIEIKEISWEIHTLFKWTEWEEVKKIESLTPWKKEIRMRVFAHKNPKLGWEIKER